MKANRIDMFEVEIQLIENEDGDAEVIHVFVGIEDRRKLISLCKPENRFVDNDTGVIILKFDASFLRHKV